MKKFLVLFAFLAFTVSTVAQTALETGDNCFDKGDYVCAKIKYQEAIGTVTGRAKQIAEIKYLRAQTCNDWLREANKAYNNKNYQEAKESYQLILNENPKDSYSASQIEECDKAITLSVSNDNITLSPSGGSKRITVNTNAASFSVSQYPTWCTVETHSSYFKIFYEANTSETSRMARFKVAAGKKEVIVSVTQPPQPKIIITFSVPKRKISIKSNTKFIVIGVNNNSSYYKITKLPSWCRVKSKSPTWFSLECDENYSPSSRTGKLTIATGGKKVKILIGQFGAGKS